MKHNKFARGLGMIVCVIAATFIFGEAVMRLWNWLMPMIFGLRLITFWQAIGLIALGKLLFGGFHRHGGRGGWKDRMRGRWANMTPEERERFRSGMKGRRCGWPIPEERDAPTSL